MSFSQIRLADKSVIQVVGAAKTLLHQKTASKAAAKLIHAGNKALGDALAERDPAKRNEMLKSLGFN